MLATPVSSRRDLVERLEGDGDRSSPSLRRVAAYVLRHFCRDRIFVDGTQLSQRDDVAAAHNDLFPAVPDRAGT